MPKLPIDAKYERLYKESHDPNYVIVKGNPLVQNVHFSMSLADQKVLASLIRSIKPKQQNLTVKFSTRDFMRMLGMRNAGDNFYNIMRAIRHISADSFWIKHPDGTYDLWQWLEDVHADPHGKGKGDFIVKFKPKLKKYLIHQSKKYRTIYKFSDIMLMKSKYSPRLYEIFRSNQSRQKIEKRGLDYSISELKYSLNLMKRRSNGKILKDKHGNIKYKYPRFANFNNKVLKPAIKEINLFCEYGIRMKKVKKGRKVVAVNVVMLKKNKKQLSKRDDIIYFITHHIPKSQWSTWREDTIRGTFHKVNPRKRSKEVTGHYHIVKPKQDEGPTKQDLKKIEDYLGKHKVPFKEVNMGGNKMEYYNPWLDAYVWTTEAKWKKQYKLYLTQQGLEKKKREIVKEFKKSRAKKNK